MPAVQTVALPAAGTDRHQRALLFGVALTSFSALLLELALTRLFSVVLFYHFAFLAISIALLGLGAGGVFAYIFKQRLAKVETRRLATILCAINAVCVVLALEVILHLPVSLVLASPKFGDLTAIASSATMPCSYSSLSLS